MSRIKTCVVCDKALPHDTFFELTPENRCIRSLADRIKELESKLGAAAAEQTASASGVPEGPAVRLGGPGVSGTAAPSVSAVVWRGRAMAYRDDGYKSAADACNLAAAVTEWYESRDGSYTQILAIACAFVRGEPLPQKRVK